MKIVSKNSVAASQNDILPSSWCADEVVVWQNGPFVGIEEYPDNQSNKFFCIF
jgi:hypothetical protein